MKIISGRMGDLLHKCDFIRAPSDVSRNQSAGMINMSAVHVCFLINRLIKGPQGAVVFYRAFCNFGQTIIPHVLKTNWN